MDEENEIPSPPPFYRVSGHFTVLNPSRPMAFSNLLENASIEDQQDSYMISKETSLVELVPDLKEDRIPSEEASIPNGWPNLERIQSVEYAFSDLDLSEDDNHDDDDDHSTKTKDEYMDTDGQDNTTSSEHSSAPRGVALLLQNQAPEIPDGHHRRRHRRWTHEEDEILKNGVELEGGSKHNWVRIADKYFRGSRNARACKGRWNNHLRPGLMLETWTKEEDNAIVKGYREGLSWPEIANRLSGGRLPEHIRNRFLNHVDPSLNKSRFTDAEKRKVFELQAVHGNKWTKIASEMPGRSEKMVKNVWFNSKLAQDRQKPKNSINQV